MKIVTFGSCLSRYIVEALQLVNPRVRRVGSVYHNRVDVFVDTVIDMSRPFISEEAITSLTWKPGQEAGAQVIIRNQIPSPLGTMGHHLVGNAGKGFFEELAEADVILMDDFVDLCAVVYQDAYGGRAFLNTKAVKNGMSRLRGIGYLTPDLAALKWEKLMGWLRARNPNAVMVFSHFPARHHINTTLRQRCDELAQAIPVRDDVLYLPVESIDKSELCVGTQSHFLPHVYDRYVKQILPPLEARGLVEKGTSEAFILRSPPDAVFASVPNLEASREEATVLEGSRSQVSSQRQKSTTKLKVRRSS